MDSLVSSRPIHYSSLVLLGEGSCGVVYRAKRKDAEFQIEQEVAIKILKSEISVADWRDEFALLVRVNSSRCVRLLGWDYLDGRPALILELVSGITLDRLIEEQVLSAEEVEEIAGQVFEGLQDISRAGLSHGDLSLKNVMVNENGEIKILDFGLFRGGSGRFTPEFAAPEIFEASEPTFFSDLYSLGRILFFIESKYKRPISPTTLKMMAIRPEDRDFQLSHTSPAERARRRTMLAERIKTLRTLAQPKSTRKGTALLTGMARIQRRSLRRAMQFIAATLTLLMIGSAPASRDDRAGHIYIRTKFWTEVLINGVSKGYAPLDLTLPSGETFQILLRTPHGLTRRTLTLQPGQNIVWDHNDLNLGESYESQLVR